MPTVGVTVHTLHMEWEPDTLMHPSSSSPKQSLFHSLWRYLGIPCGGGNGNPLQYSCLENPVDRGTWWAAIHGVAQSRT